MSAKGLKHLFNRKPIQLLASLITLVVLTWGTYTVLAGYLDLTTLISSPVGVDDYGNGASMLSSLSHLGDRVAFDSYATNLMDYDPDLPGSQRDPDGYADIFLYDTTNDGDIQLKEITIGSDGNSLYPVINKFPDNYERYNSWSADHLGWKDIEDWDGRYVAFQSRSSSFAEMSLPDPGSSWDVFLYDRGFNDDTYPVFMMAPQIYPVSVAFDPEQEPDGSSGNVGVLPQFLNSPHLGHIAANTVHPGVAVYTRVPVSSLAVPQPVVLFESDATNLVSPGTASGTRHIYTREVFGSTPTTKLLTQTPAGVPANGSSTHPTVSPDGRFVAFVSYATNLVPGVNTGGFPQIYLLDRDADGDGIFDEFGLANNLPGTGDTPVDEWDTRIYMASRVVNSDGTAQGLAGNDESWYPSITFVDAPGTVSDAVYVSFQSFANNFVDVFDDQADLNNAVDVFLYILLPNLNEGATNKHSMYIVSRASGLHGVQGNFHSLSPAISSNGQVIAFTSYASNLIKGDTNYFCEFTIDGQTRTNCPDVFVRNFDVKQTWRVSVTLDGEQPWYNSALPSISGVGRYAAFTSYADLRPEHYGDQSTSLQVYVRDQGENVGSPNIQPSSGDFYTSVGQPVWITFTLDFLQDAPLQVANAAESLITIDGEHAAFFEVVSDTCSDGTFVKGQQCTFAVQFTPTDQLGKKARAKIPISDSRGYLYISLRGFTIVRYIPLISP